jgi:two-component system LytT family response regulator
VKIKCIAIDDEPLALEQIGSYVQKTPFLELIATCKNAYEALEVLKEKEVDLMFIDIDMPDISGLDLVKSLVKKPQIIFTTAYSEYAFEGFQVDAIDYLLKPINYAAFLKAANKSKIWFEANSPEKAEQQPKSDRKEIFVKSNYKVVRILLADISYIESANEYIKIFLDNQEVITTFMRLKNIEELLPAGDFMRVHKSFIINLNKILAVDRNRIFIDKKKHIPVGEQYKEIFNKYMDDTFLNEK